MRPRLLFLYAACLLLLHERAHAALLEIGADRASAPPRKDPGHGVCVTSIHVAQDGVLKDTSEAILRLDLQVGDAGIDGKSAGALYQAINFRDADGDSAGDFTDGEKFFPFSNDPAANPPGNDINFATRVRGYLNVPRAGLITVAVNAEAGFRLLIGDLLIARSSADQSGRFTQQLRFLDPGLYRLELIQFVGTGRAILEFSSAEGMQLEVTGGQDPLPMAYKLVPTAQLYTAIVDQSSCTECTVDKDCASGSFCGDNKLCQPCLVSDRCGESCSPCAMDTPVCSKGNCVECDDDNVRLCEAKNQACDVAKNTCGPCTDVGDIKQCRGRLCKADGTCGPCEEDEDCPSGNLCLNARCVKAECSESDRSACTRKAQVCDLSRGKDRGLCT
jgi:hypothetical protein